MASISQVSLLEAINNNPGQTAADLIESLEAGSGTIYNTLVRLQARGWIRCGTGRAETRPEGAFTPKRGRDHGPGIKRWHLTDDGVEALAALKVLARVDKSLAADDAAF